MPKFLDAPQWYTSSGSLVDMGTPGTNVAGKYFGTNATGTIGYHNNQISVLNGIVPSGAMIYAPTTAGSSGQILKSNGSGAPSWEEYYDFRSIIETGSTYSDSSGGTLTLFIPKLTTSSIYSFYCSGYAYVKDKIFFVFDVYGGGTTSMVNLNGCALAFGIKGITGIPYATQPTYNSVIIEDKIRITYQFSVYTDSVFDNLTLTGGAAFTCFKDI